VVRVKICGITNLEDALAASELGADALGFVFAPSPRRIEVSEAGGIIAQFPPFVTTVGLFVNEARARVRETIERCRLNAVQFHGGESPQVCKEFMPGIKVIKAFRIKDEESLNRIGEYGVSACLLDAWVEGRSGGTGKTFDWNLAAAAKDFGLPLILSGGLNPDNVARAIERVDPYAVDVSSGVESAPGKKDYKLMKEFISRAKGI
jgi:phosphoribosylanthranilate isomerase